MVAATATFAQTIGQAEPYAGWDRTATRAENILQSDRADSDTLETLRAELARQRTEAFTIVREGSVRVRALEAQLRALGPAPADGETVPTQLAEMRAHLQDAIGRANAPVLSAEQAFQRAEVLIAEIDQKLRRRSATVLLEAGPSPLLPGRWVTAATEIGSYLSSVWGDVSAQWSRDGAFTREANRLKITILFAALGLALMLVIRPIVLSRLHNRLQTEPGGARAIALRALGYALRLLLPLIGTYLLALSVFAGAGLAVGSNVAAAILIMPMLLIVPGWLGYVLFAPRSPQWRLIGVSDDHAWSGARTSLWLGFVLGAEILIHSAGTDQTFSPETGAVTRGIMILAGSALMWRLAGLLRRAGRPEEGAHSDSASQVNSGFLLLLGRVMQISALLAVIFAAAGFMMLARQALVPMILSLGLVAALIIVYHLGIAIISLLVGRAQGEDRTFIALLPFTLGLILVVIALPVFALIWGARTSDISEIWFLANEGVQIGDTRISVETVLALAIVFAIGVFVTRWLQQLARSTILPRTHIDTGGRNAIVTGIGYVGVTLAALIAISTAGINLSSLAFVAGALSVGIGFGLQAITSNFVSGIILLVERPVKEGDWIEVSGYSGFVRKIAVRSTRIETFDRHDVIIPNSDLITGTVKNMTLTDMTGRIIVPVGVAYGSDLDAARAVLLKAAAENDKVMKEPAPSVLFMGFGESALDLELRCFLFDVGEVLTARSELLFEIYREFGAAGIEIPFPQRDIKLRNLDELAAALTGRGGEAGAAF